MKLHLGSGKRYLSGYKHIDLSPYPHIDYREPIYPLDFIPDETVSEIYCSHALEYYDQVESIQVLTAWRKKLTATGVLRLSVPDFDSLLKVYSMEDQNIERIIGPLFGRWNVSNDQLIYHKVVYTRKLLCKNLCEAGFMSTEDWDPFEFFNQDNNYFDDYSKAYYPHMDFANGFPISLNILAYKTCDKSTVRPLVHTKNG